MKVNSEEYKTLMEKWSNEAFEEELNAETEEYYEHKNNYHRASGISSKEEI